MGEGRPPTQPNVLSCIADSCATNHKAEVDYRSAPGAEGRPGHRNMTRPAVSTIGVPRTRCPAADPVSPRCRYAGDPPPWMAAIKAGRGRAMS